MNNYDQSSTDVNLNLSCFYDLDLSRHYFNECFNKDDHALTQYGSNDVYHYIDYGNIEVMDLASIDSYKATKKDILAIYDNLEVFNFLGGVYNLKDGASEYLEKPFSKLTKSDLVEYLEYLLPVDGLIKAYQEYLTPCYEIVSIRGYCQGDYAEIVVPDHYWEFIRANKTEDALNKLKDYFSNLFYDAPLYCRLTIDGDDLYFDEYIQDQYSYNTYELLAIANDVIKHEKKAYILEWLEDNLPAYPDHC